MKIARIAGDYIVIENLDSRVKRRMVDENQEENQQDENQDESHGLSLELQLGPASEMDDEEELKRTLNGVGVVQHQNVRTLVNDAEVKERQRPAMNGVLDLLRGFLPVRTPEVPVPVNPPPSAGNSEGSAETTRPRGRKRPPPQPEHPNQEKSPIIPPPYPWSTDRRAKVYSIHTLLTKGITFISGEVQCRHCEQTLKINFNLVEKFTQIWEFVYTNRVEMHERAPQKWLQPNVPTCSKCGHENSLKPIIAEKKRNINWLFLLLGEMLGLCSLEQLKYFCKHTDNHRTGAKNRVLYLAYLTLCHQLNPDSPFRR